ncbi:MAG: hypothetical protein KDJ65_33420 [Anaerolineae bacterium]|nr:hypothetical protein [Anaerolineae bacterium]
MEHHLYQPEIEALLAQLAHQGQKLHLRAAADDDIQWLRSNGVPKNVVAFFAVAEPVQWIDIAGVEIGPISGLKGANRQAVPGIAASRYGYIVIAQTISGDVYCIDTHQVDEDGQSPIYIVNHERVGEDASRQEVKAGSRLVATSFHEFLIRFIAEDLPYDFHDV